MTTHCVARVATCSRTYAMHTYMCIHGVHVPHTSAAARWQLLSRIIRRGGGGGVSPPPRAPESSNDEALDYCINNATNSAVSRRIAAPPRARTPPSLWDERRARFRARGLELESISYRLQHPSGLGHECVYTRLSAWLPTLVFRPAVKTVKTTARPIRHSAMFTSGRWARRTRSPANRNR